MKNIYQSYIEILKKELIPAMGCTEPIAIAYAAASAKEVLGTYPDRIDVYCSGNIIKNVKSVVVPHSGGKKGIQIAALLGAFYGNANKKLEVIADISQQEIETLDEIMNATKVIVHSLESDHILDIEMHLYHKDDEVIVCINDSHTNITCIKKNNEFIYQNTSQNFISQEIDYSILNVEDIYDFSTNVNIEKVKDIINRQIEYNMAIAKEGMNHSYGARIGQIIALENDSMKTQAKAYAASASDARMGGCEMPVVINSGSGNQGITASVPVVVYGHYYHKSEEEIIRALLCSNLITLHLKSGIGRLSAYCGAVSAGVGAGAGIAYLLTKDLRTINHTIVNAIAISSGIVCDGAKASCAAKIAMAVESGIFGYEMFKQGSQLRAGEGLVSKGVENTIHNISRLGHDGMKSTDKEIISIMIESM